ncbi:MAG: hypothetical protein A3C92_01925 [Candidatus Sungbacteria bacterium RIFCSPHIGHO2_02_FULL_53_17]|uniref:DUF3307 domain-containing protein n=2 Tax=Candidatus Sungiibacteriota TaxID=1817917 RepID=A0A1G2KUF9_9BACT|nr:MAG: hypothetical protein A3C92_01925 [Candidatus Sungbacteria bacterium RIFCSPHIGHO2_02_FULL_53_17]
MSMILSTHIVIAAALTRPLAAAHPLLTFAVSLVSHYAADAIPHWHYPTRTILKTEDPAARRWRGTASAYTTDALAFAVDASAGIGVVWFLARPATADAWIWLAVAASGSILPDFLQGVYMAGASFLQRHQIIHHRIHSSILLDAYPWIGIPFQLAIAAVAALFI